MRDDRGVERAVVLGLEGYLLCMQGGAVPVVRGNSAAARPGYPYVSYTVAVAAEEPGGTWCDEGEGVWAKQVAQRYSLTAQGEDPDEVNAVAAHMRDYFAVAGRTELADAGAVVAEVGPLHNRDTLLTNRYEHRMGLDVRFALIDRVAPAAGEGAGGEWIAEAEVRFAAEV